MLQNMYKIIHTTRHAGVKLPPPLVALESNSSLESCNQHAMLERGNMGWYMGEGGYQDRIDALGTNSRSCSTSLACKDSSTALLYHAQPHRMEVLLVYHR